MSSFKTVPVPSGEKADINKIFEEYSQLSETKAREDFYSHLTNKQKKVFNLHVENIARVEREEEDEDDGKVGAAPDFPAPGPPSLGVTTASTGATTSGTSSGNIEPVTDDDLRQMWTIIESMSSSELNPDEIRIFEYEGFNPNEILRALIKRKRSQKVSDEQFKKDIMILCGVAVVKGSVNDNNFKKMKKAGQEAFMTLQERYDIKMGSSKGLASDIVTTARIAASFPGVIIDLLLEEKVSARMFGGPMKSSKLPAVMRHQAMAACVPRDLGDETKSFILGCVTAFSVDQSLTISANKIKKEDAAQTQANFIRVANSSAFPSEPVRKAIFQKINWKKYYEPMVASAKELEKLNETFGIADMQTMNADIVRI